MLSSLQMLSHLQMKEKNCLLECLLTFLQGKNGWNSRPEIPRFFRVRTARPSLQSCILACSHWVVQMSWVRNNWRLWGKLQTKKLANLVFQSFRHIKALLKAPSRTKHIPSYPGEWPKQHLPRLFLKSEFAVVGVIQV